MLDQKTLSDDLEKKVKDLSEDMRARATTIEEIDKGLREAYTQIEKGGRTADAFEVWRDDYLDQVASAWVLSCVFVRFMEDNGLIDECRLAGEGERRKLAEDAQESYFRVHKHETDRDYLKHVFQEVGTIPACRDLFAEGKTPLWAVGPSGDAAMKLLAYWREIDAESGRLKRSFVVENGDTRFLGDLYQDLSERARKKYALLQTPVFIEEFILDRTLDPAIDEFGLEATRLIDPTCGSGHFLLGAFARLFELWSARVDNVNVAAQKALDGVWGVDINPFAVAIARFRLIVAALHACGIKRLKQAPGWKVHLAVGDSLLFGKRWSQGGEEKGEQLFLGTAEESWAPEIYACEDQQAIKEVLGQRYHAVVGNPPYITPKDARLNQAYRDRYPNVCYGKYSLGVPFTERFFDLCFSNGNGKSGYVGMITTDSFMKREFGKKLIEEFFPIIDLTHVINTSGVYIPGHGTPTVILFGRNRKPVGDTVRAVMGIKGEPTTPDDPSQGLVWRSIVNQIDIANTQDEFTSTSDVIRSTFASHPWSLGGGGSSQLQEIINEFGYVMLSEFVESIGITAFTLEDEVFIMTRETAFRIHLQTSDIREMVEGDKLRDWSASMFDLSVFPYDNVSYMPFIENLGKYVFRYLWNFRTNLSTNKMFGNKTKVQCGLKWFEYGRLTSKKLLSPLSITFAEVATHNHFVLDRGGKVFKQTAPIIKLKDDATEEDHIALLGLLNSSMACFWMKQVCFPKGGDQVGSDGARVRRTMWDVFYAFAGTPLQKFPVPEHKPLDLASMLDRLAQELIKLNPGSIAKTSTPSDSILNDSRIRSEKIRGRMIALQEELDWRCYHYYGLLDQELCLPVEDLPEIALGERAFEIVMARQMAKGDLETTWFERHGSKPITNIPDYWPEAYRKLVEKRIQLIETNNYIGLIEKPEYKRRWNTESWQDQESRAVRIWLLDRLESRAYWPDPAASKPALQSVARLAEKATADADFLQVAAIYKGRRDFDVAAVVAELVESESVPFLPILRYKESGLRKRELWERTWDLQRKEDAGENVGEIKVPPKYVTSDFQKPDYWRLRGKLDVPKERWISYPYAETASDPTLVVAWAGWDHLQQATALIAYYDARRREGWDAKRLTPLLAGLDQLLPWIHQWHPEIDREYGETAGRSFQNLLESDAHELGLTLAEIRGWTPPVTTARRRTRKP